MNATIKEWKIQKRGDDFMAKVFLGVGHGGKDPGAVGILTEKTVNLEMALACRDVLTRHGVEVMLSRDRDTDDSLQSRIKKCNNFNPDLAIDIHNNAGGGDGFEVYYHFKGGKSLELAQNIESEIKSIGQNSRGCKIKINRDADYFGFIRETNAPAVIVEGVFVDNPNDTEIADTIDEQRRFGIAYAHGILKTLGVTAVNQENKINVYRVQVGAFNDRQNAENMVKNLKDKGFTDAFIV